jgi:hypothetical protein
MRIRRLVDVGRLGLDRLVMCLNVGGSVRVVRLGLLQMVGIRVSVVRVHWGRL